MAATTEGSGYCGTLMPITYWYVRDVKERIERCRVLVVGLAFCVFAGLDVMLLVSGYRVYNLRTEGHTAAAVVLERETGELDGMSLCAETVEFRDARGQLRKTSRACPPRRRKRPSLSAMRRTSQSLRTWPGTPVGACILFSPLWSQASRMREKPPLAIHSPSRSSREYVAEARASKATAPSKRDRRQST
jgi:hypothetical protein